MKKIYLLGLASMFALTTNAQQATLKLNRKSLTDAQSSNSSSKTGSILQIASNITCADQYTAGVSQTFNLTLNITNSGNEYGDSLAITFPGSFSLASALPNDSIGVTEAATTTLSGCATTDGGTKEPFRGIFGQNVVWGNNDNCWGGLPSGTNPGSTMTITINAMVAPGTTGPQVVNFHISGDGFGTGPGDFSGTFTIQAAGALLPDVKTIELYVLKTPTTVYGAQNCALGTHTIATTITNIGNTVETNVPINYSVNGVSSILGAYPGPLIPGDTVTVSFPTLYDFSLQNVYNIKTWSEVAGDVSLTNDTSAFLIVNSISVPLTSMTYSNGAETTYEMNSYTNSWIGLGIPTNTTTNKHSGTKGYFWTINTAIGAPLGTYENMNIMPCTDVTAGEVYRISYWKKAITSGTLIVNGQTGVFSGLLNDFASMTDVLKPYTALTPTLNSVSPNNWTKDSVDYTATASETRYFAIGAKGTLTSSSDQINVRLDDIMIKKVTGSVGIKTIAANDAISIFPNPTSGILNVTAVEVTSSIEVFNVIGEKVYSSNLVKGNNVIDLSGLSNGAYFVKMNSNNQVITKKVVLSK